MPVDVCMDFTAVMQGSRANIPPSGREYLEGLAAYEGMMRRAAVLTGLFLCASDWCGAQTPRPGSELKFRIGRAWFLDENFPSNLTVGGSFRAYITERLSVEPEFLYIARSGRSERSYLLLPNIAYDLTEPGRRVSPYLIGGVGLFRMTTTLPGSSFTLNDVSFLGGFGANVGLKQRFFVFPEVRIGIEPNFNLTLMAGFGMRVGRNK